MMVSYKTVGLIIALLVVLMAFGSEQAFAQTPDLTGRWVSAGCEPGGPNQFNTRDFTLTRDRWTLLLTAHADQNCAVRTLSILINGPYTLGQASTTVPGATEGEFTANSVKLTPHVDQLVGLLNSATAGTCGTQAWQLDVEQDITPTGGCSVLGLRLPFTEYDIVKVEGNQLFFGARPADGSTLDAPDKRPTSFNAPVIRRPDALPATGQPVDPAGTLGFLAALCIIAGAILRLQKAAWRSILAPRAGATATGTGLSTPTAARPTSGSATMCDTSARSS